MFGNAGQQFVEFRFERLHLIVEAGNLLFHPPHLLLPGGGILPLAAQFSDLGAFGVGRGLQLLGLRNGGAAGAVQFAEPVETGDRTAACEPFGDTLEVVAEEREIVHFHPC
jgi:hypothetical protein